MTSATEAKTTKKHRSLVHTWPTITMQWRIAKLGYYRDPGENATIFLGDHSPRESPAERSSRWEEQRYNVERDRAIARAQDTNHFDYNTGRILNNAKWVGTAKEGHVESYATPTNTDTRRSV